MSEGAFAPAAAIASAIGRLDFGVGQRLRHVGLEHAELELLVLREILPPALLELGDRLAPLLDHLLDDRDDVGVGELLALVDFASA